MHSKNEEFIQLLMEPWDRSQKMQLSSKKPWLAGGDGNQPGEVEDGTQRRQEGRQRQKKEAEIQFQLSMKKPLWFLVFIQMNVSSGYFNSEEVTSLKKDVLKGEAALIN